MGEWWKGGTKQGGGGKLGVLPPRPAPPLTCSRARWPPVCARRGGTTASAAAGAPPALCGCGGGDSSDTQPHRRPPALYPPPPSPPKALPVRCALPQRPPPILVLLLVPPRHRLLRLSVPPRHGVTAGCHPRVLRHQDLGRGGEHMRDGGASIPLPPPKKCTHPHLRPQQHLPPPGQWQPRVQGQRLGCQQLGQGEAESAQRLPPTILNLGGQRAARRGAAP